MSKLQSYLNHCTDESFLRGNWFSRTYATNISIDGTEPLPCCLTHIQIPFTDINAAIAATRFRLSKADMPAFYEWLWGRIQTHVNVHKWLRARSTNITVMYKADVVMDGETKHIFLITPYYRKLYDSIKGQEIPYATIIGIGVRTAAIIRDLNAIGISHGNICLESMYVDKDGKIILGDFRFSSIIGNLPDDIAGLKDQIDSTAPYQFVIPPHVPERDLAAQMSTSNSDIAALSSLLWNMLSETPADVRNNYLTIPPKMPQECIDLLIDGMDFKEDISAYRKSISAVLRAAKKEYGDSGLGFFIPKYTVTYKAKEEEELVSEQDVLSALASLYKGSEAEPQERETTDSAAAE